MPRPNGLFWWCLVASLIAFSHAAYAKTWDVKTVDELKTAFSQAQAGDEIELADGEYLLTAALRTATAGKKGAPIVIKSKRRNKAKLSFSSQEGLVINHEWWEVDGLWISGCLNGCAAGVHVKPGAHNFLLTRSTLTDWSQHVKGSRTKDTDGAVNDAKIINNEFYNTMLRDQNGGSTPIDIVGGRRWYIARNYVHDYGGDPNGDYGIFLKGVTYDGMIEQNLVVGSTSPAFAKGAIVGISFGGGGTGAQFVPNGDISCEDYNSVARNNIILNTTDAGLHTKRACGSKFYHNMVYKAGIGLQIQIDGAKDPVLIQHNLLGGRITGKNNRTEIDNWVQVTDQDFAKVFTDPAKYDFSLKPAAADLLFKVDTLNAVSNDYCDVNRANKTSYGAIATMDARCKVWPWPTNRSWANEMMMPDMGMPDMGMADMTSDMKTEDMSDMPPSDMSGGQQDMTSPKDMISQPSDLPTVGRNDSRDDDGCQSVPSTPLAPSLTMFLLTCFGLGWRRRHV